MTSLLALRYNSFKTANLANHSEWERIFVLHDPWRNRGSRWWDEGKAASVEFAARVRQIGKDAAAHLAGLPKGNHSRPFPKHGFPFFN